MTTRAIHPKSSCCVIGCRHTSRRFAEEWLCGEHWRLVDRRLKAFRTRRLTTIYRLCERYYAAGHVARGDFANLRWQRLERATWRRMKAQAIQRAAGL